MKIHLIAALLFVSGCANNGPSQIPPPPFFRSQVKSNFHRVSLQWEWKQFVLDNYKDAVKSAMATPWLAEFPAEPDSVVQLVDDRSGRVALVASGMVNTVERSESVERSGLMLRFKYRVFWVRSRGETISVVPGGEGEAQVYSG